MLKHKGLINDDMGADERRDAIMANYMNSGFVPNYSNSPVSLDDYIRREFIGQKFTSLSKMVGNSWQSRAVSGQMLSMADETGFKNKIFGAIAKTFDGGFVPMGTNPVITEQNWSKVNGATKQVLSTKWKKLINPAPIKKKA
jgi:hypothetical protein